MAPSEPPKGCLRPSGATSKPPVPAPDPRADQAAEEGIQEVSGEVTGKPQDKTPASPSLQRYLSNPAAYEMRALGLPASNSPLVAGDPGSHKATSTSANRSTVASQGPVPKPGGPSTLLPASISEAPLEADPSISLSPSPPACPSSEEDAGKPHDLRGLGAAGRQVRNARVGHRRINRSARARKGKKCEKKP